MPYRENYRNFCIQLSADGVNVLGIGDTPYDALHPALQEALTEYYRVDSMESYEDMYRAVAYFCFKHGRIDGLESNNEYWLEQDARLREDFNIPGMKPEELSRIKCKSGMKSYYEQAEVSCARYHLVTDLEGSLAFIEKVGYPVIVKPDNGVGAADTYKISTEEELRRFHGMDPGGVQLYKDWADMVAFDRLVPKEEPLAGEAAEAGSPGKEPKKYYCASVGLRDSRQYVHTDEEVRAAYADRIVLTQRLSEVLAHAMGDTLYLARFETKKEMDAFFRFATKEQ